jgi:hypothetical protein
VIDCLLRIGVLYETYIQNMVFQVGCLRVLSLPPK